MQNTQVLTSNAEDTLLASAVDSIDPVVGYFLLGDTVSEGVFGWIAFGVDPTVERATNVFPAVWLTEEGGVVNPNGGDWRDEIDNDSATGSP